MKKGNITAYRADDGIYFTGKALELASRAYKGTEIDIEFLGMGLAHGECREIYCALFGDDGEVLVKYGVCLIDVEQGEKKEMIKELSVRIEQAVEQAVSRERENPEKESDHSKEGYGSTLSAYLNSDGNYLVGGVGETESKKGHGKWVEFECLGSKIIHGRMMDVYTRKDDESKPFVNMGSYLSRAVFEIDGKLTKQTIH